MSDQTVFSRTTTTFDCRECKRELVKLDGDIIAPPEPCPFCTIEMLKEALHQDGHIIIFSDDGWSIQHLVECRPDMTKCEIHKRAQIELVGTDWVIRGKFKVSILDGVLNYERIDEQGTVDG